MFHDCYHDDDEDEEVGEGDEEDGGAGNNDIKWYLHVSGPQTHVKIKLLVSSPLVSGLRLLEFDVAA